MSADKKIQTVYCDTDTLLSNIEEDNEIEALTILLELHKGGKIRMYRSNVVGREIMNTKDLSQRQKLLEDFHSLPTIPNDEKVLGF